MLGGSSLAKVLQLPQDDIFRRRDADFACSVAQSPAQGKGPVMQRIQTDCIDIRLLSRSVMDDVEMPALTARNLNPDHLNRRNVEVRFRKGRVKAANIGGRQFEHQVQIVCQAGLAVNDGAGRPGDHVRKTQTLQRLREEPNESGSGMEDTARDLAPALLHSEFGMRLP